MLSTTDLVGTAAAVCTTLSFVPQIIHIVKTRNTEGISLTMYSVFTFGILLWLAYGFMLSSLPIIVANMVTALLAGSVLAMKIHALWKKKHTLKEQTEIK